MNNDKMAGMDLFGMSCSWVELANTLRKRVTNNPQALLDPQDAWKLWFDATASIWQDVFKMGEDPHEIIANWIKGMEQIQERAASGEFISFDPLALFNEWYNVTSKPWAGTVENLIASEPFLAFTGPFLKSYSSLISTFRNISEASCKMLRLPTLSDIAHIAELIIHLEEKVDDMEEAIEDVKEQTTLSASPVAKITDMEQRISQIESKLDKVLALLGKGEAEPTDDGHGAMDKPDRE